ncbi:MAG: hypothetical protein H6708_13475 [Kofleriaceae bacterium]|nr:hypothetical protein [Myxococcales bacterium]MCB9561411.1 hypothetical protein [Kofleriaceae bacterium]
MSAILPFADHEDVIGAAVLHLASHLRELGVSFEILAIDEDSGDNSHAVLALLRAQVPELRVTHAPGRGRGFDTGIARAQGRVLWLIEPPAAAQPLAAFLRTYEQIRDEAIDAAIVRGRFVVAHRTRAMSVAAGLRGMGDVYFRRLAKRLGARGLRLDIQLAGGGPAPVPARGLFRRRTSIAARRASAKFI